VSFDSTTAGWLAVVGCLLGLAALVVALACWRRPASARRGLGTAGRPTRPRRRPVEGAELTPAEVADQLQVLHDDAETALRHVAVVRYDAFADMGGHLSWSLALLDDRGDGLVLTSIHGRSDSRSYAKNVGAWLSSQQLSPEEQQAIGFARSPQ
jgi:hypothetical protein